MPIVLALWMVAAGQIGNHFRFGSIDERACRAITKTGLRTLAGGAPNIPAGRLALSGLGLGGDMES